MVGNHEGFRAIVDFYRRDGILWHAFENQSNFATITTTDKIDLLIADKMIFLVDRKFQRWLIHILLPLFLIGISSSFVVSLEGLYSGTKES